MYTGATGAFEWLTFLQGFEFPDFSVETMSAGQNGKVIVTVSYTPTFKATGKTAPTMFDAQVWTIKGGKVSSVKFLWDSPSEIDKIFKKPSLLNMAAEKAGEIKMPEVKMPEVKMPTLPVKIEYTKDA